MVGSAEESVTRRGNRRYEFTGTTLEDYPLPSVLPLERARLLDGLAQDLAAREPSAVVRGGDTHRRGPGGGA